MLGLFPPMTSNALWENSGQKRELSVIRSSINHLPPLSSPPPSHKGIQSVGGCDPVDQKTNLVRDIKKCVCMTKLLLQMTILPGRKKTQLAFDPERERAKLQLSQH